MEYFEIEKTSKKSNLEKKLELESGYKFKHKTIITMYNKHLIERVLAKKMDNSLKKIINLYNFLDEDDEDGVNELRAKIETLRNLLLGDYYKHMKKSKIKEYLIKLDSLDSKVKSKFTKKRSR